MGKTWCATVGLIGLALTSTVSGLPSEFEASKLLEKRQAQQPFNDDYDGPILQSPPSYPSPWSSGKGDWAAAHKKAVAFVSQLTLIEKVNLTTGTGYVPHLVKEMTG